MQRKGERDRILVGTIGLCVCVCVCVSHSPDMGYSWLPGEDHSTLLSYLQVLQEEIDLL